MTSNSHGAKKYRSLPSRSSGTTKKRAMASRAARSLPVTTAEKNRRYFKHPEAVTEPVRKYCRCLADVAAKQGKTCLRQNKSKSGKGRCYNPYAICGRIKPKSMGRGGCAMLYNYKTMPLAQKEAVANLHNKTMKEMIAAAKEEARRMK